MSFPDMFLSRVTIQNFRAIRSIELSLDERATVLIGENGSGKTSVLDTLHACLGVRSGGPELIFDRRDFRPPPDAADERSTDPIRITLRFEERKPDEWDAQREVLGPAIASGEKSKSVVTWEILAVWNAETGEAVSSCCFLDAEGKTLRNVCESSIVSELRRLNPFLLFRQNHRRLDDEQSSAFEPAERFLRPSTLAEQGIEQVTREIYTKLSEGWEALSDKDMRKARAAAKRVWKRLVHPRKSEDKKTRHYRLPSGGAQALGPLLVFGALLQARGARPLDPDVDPIFAADHFGAHLHPSTLGSVRQVLDSLPVQKLISTYSREIVGAMPLRSLRRMVRRRSGVEVYQFDETRLKADDRRRLGYHIRARRGGALFDRCWLLVEGETEYWLLPEMARLCGYEFDAEGVGIVEFAQCGIRPIIELARDLGISWHLLADGDDAGDLYVQSAAGYLDGAKREEHITQLPRGDVERYLWSSGYADVYVEAARYRKKGGSKRHPDLAITRAINARSKPFLALSVIEAIAEPGSPGVPSALRTAIETSVRLARSN